MLPASEPSSPAGMTEKFPCLFHDKEPESLQREDPGPRIQDPGGKVLRLCVQFCDGYKWPRTQALPSGSELRQCWASAHVCK